MGGLFHSSTESDLGACNGQKQHDAGVRKIVKHSCELCNENAHVYCAADEAQLCFVCDYKVHNANFLVSKHSRNVLCSSCGTPTVLGQTGRWIERRTRHCTECLHSTGQCGGRDDVAVPGATPLSSFESCNSSCCTEDDQIPVSRTGFHSKRRATSLLEEGCGDSEDQCQSPPAPPRKRVALTRDRSHGRGALRKGTSS